MARSFHILSLILILGVSVLLNCAVPEEPEPEIDLAKGPEKPPMDLDKPPPEEVSLIERMGYEDKDVRYAAYDELIAMGADAVPLLVEGLKHEDAGIRNASASTLGKIGPDAVEAVPALIEALDDVFSRVRITVAQTIGKIGPGAAEAIPVLIEKLKTGEDAINHKICTALTQLKPESIPALIELLEGDDGGLIYWAMKSLEKIGPDAAMAVDPLVDLLRRPGAHQLWSRVCQALVGIGPEASLLPMIDIIENHEINWMIRSMVIYSIGEFGKHAAEAVPALMKIYETNDAGMQLGAKAALKAIGINPEAIITKFEQLLEDESPIIRRTAAYLLGQKGKDAEYVLPKLKGLSESDPDEEVRKYAQEAIDKIEAALNEE